MNENLLKFLTQATVVIVNTVSASTILSYVESRMVSVVPNLLIVVGSSTTEKLMSTADGLTNLSKMSPCSISLIDAYKNVFEGFSSTTAMLEYLQ